MFRGTDAIRSGELPRSAQGGWGGLPEVLRECDLITGSVDLACTSGIGALSGLSELFCVHENADTAFEYATRLERIDPTGREGRLVVR